MSSREVIEILKRNGWFLVRVSGSHHQFLHPSKLGNVTVPHPVKDLSLPVLRSIERQAKMKIR
ncbi:MAG: type II toxin-antitoxin system HicA family toxin [Magnetococcales bacterium]|nr:type II toxin-antitoxin system HicA family toxin [Magnetococcales bacterium]